MSKELNFEATNLLAVLFVSLEKHNEGIEKQLSSPAFVS